MLRNSTHYSVQQKALCHIACVGRIYNGWRMSITYEEWIADGNHPFNRERQNNQWFQSSCTGRDDIGNQGDVAGLLKLRQ